MATKDTRSKIKPNQVSMVCLRGSTSTDLLRAIKTHIDASLGDPFLTFVKDNLIINIPKSHPSFSIASFWVLGVCAQPQMAWERSQLSNLFLKKKALTKSMDGLLVLVHTCTIGELRSHLVNTQSLSICKRL